jgi:hypothetical protein
MDGRGSPRNIINKDKQSVFKDAVGKPSSPDSLPASID